MKREKKAAKWGVYLLRKKARWIGSVEAANEKEALERARKELEIPEAEKFRISVHRS